MLITSIVDYDAGIVYAVIKFRVIIILFRLKHIQIVWNTTVYWGKFCCYLFINSNQFAIFLQAVYNLISVPYTGECCCCVIVPANQISSDSIV